MTYLSSNRKPSSAACAVPPVRTTIGLARSEPSEQHFSLATAAELLGRYSKIAPPLHLEPDTRRRQPAITRPRLHNVRKRLNSEDFAGIAADYQAGQSTIALVKTYALGKGTVLSILANQGVQMRGQGIPEGQLDEAIRLYIGGLSLKRVADRLGCSAETVRQTLLAAGVPLRRQLEHGPL